MAKPTTSAEVWTAFGKVVKLVNETEKFGQSAATNYRGLYEAVIPTLEGEFLPRVVDALDAHRAGYASLLTKGVLRGLAANYMREFGSVLDFPETETNAIAERLRIYMAELGTPQTLNQREMTFGTPTAGGSNAGNGKIYRVTVDEYGYPIENVSPDAYTLKCVRDQNQVNEAREVFEFRSGNADRDALTATGQGIISTLTAIDARAVATYLQNPSFTNTSGSGSTLDFPGWTLSDASLFEASTTTYKGYIGEGTGYALGFTDNANAYQEPVDAKSSKFTPSVPWLFDFAMYRESTADGTLTVEFGGLSRAITVSSQADGSWARYTVPATPGEDSWYRNWGAADFKVKFTLSGNTTGKVLIDDIVLAPMTNLAGHYFLAVGGSTAWLRDDVFTWTNTDGGTRAIFAYWCWRMGLPNFPTASGGAEVISDP